MFVIAITVLLGFQIQNVKINSDVISSLPMTKMLCYSKKSAISLAVTEWEW